MSQVSKFPISKETNDRIFEIFLKTLINIKDKNEGGDLIHDFFTPTERVMFSKRLGIALLLERGCDYQTIKSILKVSSATIASVNQTRQDGNNSYRIFISKIIKEEQVSNFLEELLLAVVSIPAASNKGSALWKQAKKDLKNSQRKKATSMI